MKLKKFIFTILFTVFIILIYTQFSYAGELNLTKLDYQVTLNKDGSADITETWNISIENTNTLFKTFEIDNTYKEITNVKVAEIINGKRNNFKKINQEMYHVTQNCFYSLINSNNKFEIAWGVNVKNDTKTYEITYRVVDCIKTYNDCSELYWQFISTSSAIPADLVTGTIKLPSSVKDKQNLRAWAHGPLNGDISIESNDTINFKVDYLQENILLEARIVTLENVFPNNKNIVNKDRFNTIINEETNLANSANEAREEQQKNIQKQKRNETIKDLILIFSFLIISIVSVVKIRKYYKETKLNPKLYPEQIVDYYREIPNEKTTPAEATFLYYFRTSKTLQSNMPKILSSTMLDLCMKKFLEFELEQNKGKDTIKIVLKNSDKQEQLKRHEQSIYKLLKEASNKKTNSLTMKEFEKHAKKHARSFINTLVSIETQVKLEQENEQNYNQSLITKSGSYLGKGIIYLVLFFVTFIFFPLTLISLLNIHILIYILTALIIAPIFASAIYCFILYSRNNRLTQKGINEKELWRGLKKYMEEFSLLNEREVPELVIWEKYLVYATAFGIADKVLKQLKIKYPQITDETYFILILQHICI